MISSSLTLHDAYLGSYSSVIDRRENWYGLNWENCKICMKQDECDPNCEAVEDDKRIFIEAIKNIQPGTELCYDYGFEVDEEDLEEEVLRYPCYCGTDTGLCQCRKSGLYQQSADTQFLL